MTATAATAARTTAPRAAWRVPGRIEVLGKHTDYAGGRVLVGAVDRGVTVVAEPVPGAGDGTLEATSDGQEPVRLTAGSDPSLPAGHWGRYLQTVLDRLTANFGPSVPARLSVTSDLPPASGMSSSSALICASALALADLNGWSRTDTWRSNVPDPLAAAGYLAGVEAGRPWRELPGAPGVGTQGGSEDHTGIMCGARDELLLAQFDPMGISEHVSFPAQWAIVVGVSGILAEKTGAALADYNRGPSTLRDVVARWNERTGRRDAVLASAVRSLVGEATGESAADDPALAPLLDLTAPGYERGRVEQFLLESLVLVPAGTRAVRDADGASLGEILRRSHELAESRLLNQVPATTAMVSLARGLGAIGASAFGAGWGGSVYAVVPTGDAEDFARAWLAEYRSSAAGAGAARGAATTIVTRPGPGASRLSVD